MTTASRCLNAITVVLALVGATHVASAELAETYTADYGPTPTLPEPTTRLLPEIHIAKAVAWQPGETPVAAAGLRVAAFATALAHPRWLYVLPNGDVLVAETNAPERPEDSKGIRGWFQKRSMSRAGAGVPSAERITLLRDADGDGRAELNSVFIKGLHSPFGMALVGKTLYVANTDAIVSFDYTPGATSLTGAGRKVVALPGGPLNHHWTKSLLASRDGKYLYVGVGSNSNAAENGLNKEAQRAAILQFTIASKQLRSFATGLRNPVGMAWQPQTNVQTNVQTDSLWVVVNERDELGDHLVPDYLTSVKAGGFYGWPYSYYGQHVDHRVPENPTLVASALKPDYALGSHTASLGLSFYDAALLPERYRHGVFIGQHGSWNRSNYVGYKVIFVAFANGKPTGLPEDVLTGFLTPDGDARGRPVGVTVDAHGALLVADDVGNAIWRVIPAR